MSQTFELWDLKIFLKQKELVERKQTVSLDWIETGLNDDFVVSCGRSCKNRIHMTSIYYLLLLRLYIINMIFIQKNIKYIIIDAVHSQSGDADSWRNPSPFFHEIIFIKGVEPSSDNSFIEIYLEKILK